MVRTDLIDKAPALSVTGATKHFGGVAATCGVRLVVPGGERRALIGPNGAGKTTLFNLITGELTMDSGDVELFGTNVTRLSVQERKQLGLSRTYQISNLFLGLTVEENFFLAVDGDRMPGLFRSWTKDLARRKRAREASHRVGLEHRLYDRANILSHGERRQLEVGLALATRPRLILLDEPCAGLSPEERLKMMDLIKGLDAEVTLLLIEHDMEVAFGCTNYVTVLHEGFVIAEGDPTSCRGNDLVQAVYMGQEIKRG